MPDIIFLSLHSFISIGELNVYYVREYGGFPVKYVLASFFTEQFLIVYSSIVEHPSKTN